MRPHACAAAILFSAIVYAPAPGNSAPAKSSPNPTCPIHKIEPSSAHKERYFVDCSPGTLLEQFPHEKLSVAKRLLRTHIGKWIQAQGKIIEIEARPRSHKAWEVDFEADNSVISVSFGKSWYQQVSGLKNGDRIAVIGQIQNANLLGVEGVPDLALINGEIINSGAH